MANKHQVNFEPMKILRSSEAQKKKIKIPLQEQLLMDQSLTNENKIDQTIL